MTKRPDFLTYIAPAAALLASIGLSACGNTQAVVPVPPPTARPTAEVTINPCDIQVDDPREDQLCYTAIKAQLGQQGFTVIDVVPGIAVPFWADISLPQCKKPVQRVGFYDLEDPIKLAVVGSYQDGREYTVPDKIPKSRCD